MSDIGIDTNVLLRMVFNDDPRHRAAALRFGETLSENRLGFVSLIVIVELYWSLTSRYRQPKDAALQTLRVLLRTKGLLFEDFDSIVRAIHTAAGTKADFADALIAEKSKAHGCLHTVTFDRDAAKAIPSMELLS